MSSFSVCGIDCDACKYRTEQNCGGCKYSDCKVFWGECEIYKCNIEKNQEHCGKCNDFPCDKLKAWAEKENPERIENLRQLTSKE